jgi:hypothetical protein
VHIDLVSNLLSPFTCLKLPIETRISFSSIQPWFAHQFRSNQCTYILSAVHWTLHSFIVPPQSCWLWAAVIYIFWARSPISFKHVTPFWYPIVRPHVLTTHHSHTSIRLEKKWALTACLLRHGLRVRIFYMRSLISHCTATVASNCWGSHSLFPPIAGVSTCN